MSKMDPTIFHFSHLTISFPDISTPIPGTTILPRQRAEELVLPSLPIHLTRKHISIALSSSCTIPNTDAVDAIPDLLAFFHHFSIPILSVLCTSLCCFAPNGLYLR